MSKLDFIVSAIFYGGVQSTVKGATIKTPVLSKEDGKQQVKDLLLQMIGDDDVVNDERPGGDHLWLFKKGRNELRVELRKVVDDL